MTRLDWLGFPAAGFVLARFWMKRLIPLCVIGIASNPAFISYG
jgi:hypothetical protein